jgi:hypothetical protein
MHCGKRWGASDECAGSNTSRRQAGEAGKQAGNPESGCRPAPLSPPADVFTTFKDLLTRHKPVVAQFLVDNYTEVGRVKRGQQGAVAAAVFLAQLTAAGGSGPP